MPKDVYFSTNSRKYYDSNKISCSYDERMYRSDSPISMSPYQGIDLI